MNKSDLLLEIGTEEIPSGYFGHIHELFSFGEGSPMRELFASSSIPLEGAKCFTTPRRIILFIKDVPMDQDIIIDGPPVKVAYDSAKNPTKALEVFMQKNNAQLKDVETVQGEKDERVRIVKKGIPNKAILEGLLPKVVERIDFPKTMRWDDKGMKFARPVRWITALFGTQVLKFSAGGIASSNITRGHRFLGRQRVKVKDPASFFKALTANKVVWDNAVRKDLIRSYLEKRNWHANEALLDEVSNLNESLFFIEGAFRNEYVGLPQEVLIASMAKHQRIFCLRDRHGRFTNRFVGVLNGKYGGRKLIIKHFENVLDARLKDALFFYKSDTKVRLSEWADGLKSVVFHKQLGTIKDKIGRMGETAHYLAKKLGLNDEENKDLSRAVLLCKADLLTQMVGEFPSLQGTMGRYYALETGEKKPVAEAIGEHYLPRFADDLLPGSKAGIACSLADKFDNIISYFKIGKFPKSSWDLYALRRQGIGIISILINKGISISLGEAFDFLYERAPGDFERDKLKKIFLDFFRERFIVHMKEKYSFRYDLVDSVACSGADDIYNSFLKLNALNSIINNDCFEKARCIVERTYNIIRTQKGEPQTPKASLFKQDEEAVLYDKYKSIKDEFLAFCLTKEFQKATELYSQALSELVHNYFDKVMVNVDDKELKDNRMGLLFTVNRLYADNIADLSKIVAQQSA